MVGETYVYKDIEYYHFILVMWHNYETAWIPIPINGIYGLKYVFSEVIQGLSRDYTWT